MAKIALWRRSTPRSRFCFIKGPGDTILTSDLDMASRIRMHWQKVFQVNVNNQQHTNDMHTLANLVPEATGVSLDPFDIDDITISLRRHDSAPGPDGLCYSAWRAAGEHGQLALLDTALSMWNGALPPASFSKSLMVFLPKSDEQNLAPDELRPLSLCDTDYKVIMGCINHRLALMLPDFVDDRQRGFLKSRLGLDNLLLIEAASMLAARSGSRAPVMCFLDIAAAFPSILQDYMILVLKRFLGEHPLVHMISSMYKDNSCQLVVRGSVFPGFRIVCGVRQGCPLSGSLFALTFHPVIVFLSNSLFKHSMTVGHDLFAYADDLALVLYDFWKQLNPLATALSIVASATGLHISWRKVQIVPLARNPDIPAFRRRLSATRPAWSTAKIGLSAKYLGILVGPEVTDKSNMAAPLAKYFDRCRFIARLGLGWVRAAAMHNIFALPVLSYVAQVQGDNGIDDTDLDRAAAILFRCPMYRPPFNFFMHLKDLGCDLGLKDVRLECQAAAARCSLSLAHLGQARRRLVEGSNDEHLCLHPLRAWQNRSATAQLGIWQDRLRRECPDLRPPFLQRQCRGHLQSLRAPFNYHELIASRIATVLRRRQVEDPELHNIMATFLLEVIIMSSTILNCTALQSFLRICQNGLTVSHPGDTLQACPLCQAVQAGRLSHLLNCGAVWLFLAEHCPGLAWDFSASERWQLLLGASVQDSESAAALCVAWDTLASGVQAGRFGGCGFEACAARLTALCSRPGHVGRVARLLRQPPAP
jgi:hypothetical protein